ncbi:MAG TPA: HEAT repeat domain-containing protein [Pyrinomonadaceae bacterium]|jgi:hypothetical protein
MIKLIAKHTFTIVNVFLIIFLFLLICNLRAAAQTTFTDTGHKLEIQLKPDKKVIMLNEPAFLFFEIKNYSSEDLCVWQGGDYRNRLGRPNSFTVTVTKEDGRAVPQPEAFGNDGLGVDCVQIPAYGSHILKLFLPHWATFETPGFYTVNVQKRLAVQIYSIWKNERSMESSSRLQAETGTKFQVVAKDEKKLGEIIDSFGAVTLDVNNPEAADAALALAYINDKRVIPYFAQALEKFNKHKFDFESLKQLNISQRAIYALSKFNDRAALEALEAAMNSPSEDTRESIAVAFRNMSHPKVRNLLLKMLKDENVEVRKAARETLAKRGRK